MKAKWFTRSAVLALAAAAAFLSLPAAALDIPAAVASLRLEQARLRALPETPGALRTDVKLRKGMSGPDVAALRARLAQLRPDLLADGGGDSYDQGLVRAVSAFQRAYGLDADGVAGPATLETLNRPVGRQVERLELNVSRLERIARHLGDVPARMVLVNIPAFALAAYENGAAVLGSPVIVGKTATPTPPMLSRFVSLKFNPDWRPAKTNHRRYVAALARGDLDEIRSHGLRVLDRGGAEVPLEDADADAFRALGWRFWQPPGADNALGHLKFEIATSHADGDGEDIYLHDTNERHRFAAERRAFSGGCVRVQAYEELAAWLMGRDVEDVRARVARGGTAWERVPPVPLAIAYLTAFPGADGSVSWHPDVYGRDHDELRAQSRGS